MKKGLYHKTRMTPGKVIETLQKKNISIAEKEAVEILHFLRRIAKIKVTAYLEDHGHRKENNS